MNLRWLLGNFTDPQYALSRKKQFHLSNEAHKRYVTMRAFLIRSALILLPLLVLITFLQPMLAALGFGGSTLAYALAMLTYLVLFWPWSAWMYRTLYVVPIRKAMRDAGFVLCLNCGYELRGLPADVDRCPECCAARDSKDEQPDKSAEPNP